MTNTNPYSPTTAQTGNVLTASGLLSKAIDTALDVYTLREAGKAVPGSVYPSGQVNPESLTPTPQQQNKAAMMPFYIGGGVAVLVVILVLVSRK